MIRRLPIVWMVTLFCLCALYIGSTGYAAAATCGDDDGNTWECPTATVNAPPTGVLSGEVPIPPVCHEVFPTELKGATSMPPNLKYLNEKVCQAYKDLLVRFPSDVGNCTANSGVDKRHAVTGLNGDFAVALDAMLKDSAMAGVMITSAYRKNPCSSGNGTEGAKDSSHMYGCAVDLNIIRPVCDTKCKWIAGDGGAKYGLQVRASYMNIGPNEYNHVEPGRSFANVVTCKNKGLGGGVVPGTVVPSGTSVAGNTSQTMCAQQYASNPAGYAACVQAYQKIDAQLNNPTYGTNYGTPIAGRCYRTPGGLLQELPCASSNSG